MIHQDHRFRWRVTDSYFEHPNGSKLYLRGVNHDKGESARGTAANIIVADEFGSWRDPDYVVKSILRPQLDTTDGSFIICSTPSPDLGHSYYRFKQDAIANERFIQRVIYDNASLSKDRIAEICREVGGEDSPSWQREYLCRPVTNPERLVIPEFSEEIHVKDLEIPFHESNRYVGVDLGFSDFTAFLFASHHFPTNLLYIHDELVLQGKNSEQIVKEAKQKEALNFQDKTIYRRVSDNDLQMLFDMNSIYGYSIIPTRKDDKQAVINQLRIRFTTGTIAIHPRCKNLIFQLKVGLWNPSGAQFQRGAATGHLDAVDALIYLNRNLDMAHNPYTQEIDFFSTFQNPHHVAESDKGIHELGDFFNQHQGQTP